MHASHVRNWITVAATMVAVVFIGFTYWHPSHAVFWLSIEVVILPTIYIVGNTYLEREFDRRYREELVSMEVTSSVLNRKYYKARERIKQLEDELRGRKDTF